MADQKLTQLGAEATPTDDDILYLVDDPGGAGIGPTSKKVVIGTLFNPLPGTLTLANAGLHLLDTGGNHDLIISPGTDLDADRVLTLVTGDADRTITLSGNPVLSDWFDQSVKQAASPTFADVFLPDGGTIGIDGNELLTFNAAGNATFSGVGSVIVPDGAWVGADAACSWVFDSTNGDVTTQDNVGVGTIAPNAIGSGGVITVFTVHKAGGSGNLQLTSDLTADNSLIGVISFGTTGAATRPTAGSIQMELEGIATTNASGNMRFYTRDGATFGERMVITSGGRVGVGESVPVALLHVDQVSTTAAVPVLILDQADISDGFINFIGSNRGGVHESLSAPVSVRVELAGVIYRLALYADV